MLSNAVCRWLLVLPLILLVGCGFKLRGDVEVPVYLSPMTVESPRLATNLVSRLRHALQAQGVQLIADAKTAASILRLERDNYTRKVLTVGSDGKVKEYLLQYRVHFSIQAAEGGSYLKSTELLLERDLSFDANNVTASSTEEARLKDAMVEDAVLQILRRLQYIKPLGKTAQ